MSDAELFADSDWDRDSISEYDYPMSPVIPPQNEPPNRSSCSLLTPLSSSTPDRGSYSRMGKRSSKEKAKARIESSESEDDSIPQKKKSCKDSNDIADVKKILQDLCKRVEQSEWALRELQKSQESLNSTLSTTDQESEIITKKKHVPNYVRKEVRKVYQTLKEEDENFQGWTISNGKTYKDRENQAVVTKLISEVKGLNHSFSSSDIREAAYRFYRTRCDAASAKRRGTETQKRTTKRRHERIVRKLKERTSALMKNPKLTEEARQKWLKVMVNDMMSSEESGGDDDVVVCHPLPWRTAYVTKMFTSVDNYCKARKSAQARRQIKPRISGTTSRRTAPTCMPSWVIKP